MPTVIKALLLLNAPVDRLHKDVGFRIMKLVCLRDTVCVHAGACYTSGQSQIHPNMSVSCRDANCCHS